MPRAEVTIAAEVARRPSSPRRTERGIRHAVLCSPQDASGPWARAVLLERGLTGVRLVTTEEIVYSTRVVHRQAGGVVSTEILLPDGDVLGPGLRSVLNRVITVPSAHLAGAVETDRSYAVQELHAVLTSVLASLPGVVNAAGPRGLPGPWLRDAEWLCEAARAGLEGVGWRSGQPAAERPVPDRRVVVIGDEVISEARPVPEHVQHGCRALSRRTGASVLGVDFVVQSDARWLFAGANPTPDLRYTGAGGADAFFRLMTGGDAP